MVMGRTAPQMITNDAETIWLMRLEAINEEMQNKLGRLVLYQSADNDPPTQPEECRRLTCIMADLQSAINQLRGTLD